MREAVTALRYAETTSRMVILRGWAENRLVCPRSLFLFLSVSFSDSRRAKRTTGENPERVETHYSSEDWDILRCSFHISLMNGYKHEWMNNVSVVVSRII